MLKLVGVKLTKVGTYEKANIRITKNDGLVIMSGHNKDSLTSDSQNNGAGKTLLWSAISNCRYAAAPSSTAKNTKKDMLDQKGSSIELLFIDNHGHKIKFIQTPSKWTIFEDGVDQEVHRLSHQQKKMEHYFPLTESEFYAYTYLTSIQGQRMHFQVDKPTERLKFITDIFKLDDYDRMKSYFTQKLGTIKDEQIRFDVIESKLLSINTQLNTLDWSKSKNEEAASAKEEFKLLKSKRDKLSSLKTKQETQLRRLKGLIEQVKNRDELLDKYSFGDKEPSELADKIKGRRKILRDYQTYLDEKNTYNKSTRRLEDRLSKLRSELTDDSVSDVALLAESYKTTKEVAKELSKKIKDAERNSGNLESLDTNITRIKELIKFGGYAKPKDVDMTTEIDDDLAICHTTIKLKKLLDVGESVCPTCHQDVDIDEIASSIKKAQKRIQKLEDLKNIRLQVEKYAKYKKQRKELGEAPNIESMEKRYDKLIDSLEQIKENLDLLEKIKDLEDDLKSIAEPKKPSKVPPSNVDEEELTEIIKACNELSNINSAIEASVSDDRELAYLIQGDIKAHAEELNEEHASTLRKLKKLDKKYQDLMQINSRFDLQLGEFRILSQQRLELEADITKAKPLLEQRDLIKSLEKAYGAKGLKVRKANEIVGLLEANLNRYSNLLFAEAFTFKVYATEAGVFCDVDRNNGSKATDVRLMSGAESDCFKLLFLASLLLLVPSDRRTNFVVLDEPDSHMDDSSRLLFIERFIPFLREVVPHIFLITPKDHHRYSKYNNWTAIKENGVSRLHIGN